MHPTPEARREAHKNVLRAAYEGYRGAPPGDLWDITGAAQATYSNPQFDGGRRYDSLESTVRAVGEAVYQESLRAPPLSTSPPGPDLPPDSFFSEGSSVSVDPGRPVDQALRILAPGGAIRRSC